MLSSNILYCAVALTLQGSSVTAFHQTSTNSFVRPSSSLSITTRVDAERKDSDDYNNGNHDNINNEQAPTTDSRRSFLTSVGLGVIGGGGMTWLPQVASAGIDVSGLSVQGGDSGNADLANQLKAYDGSGSARVRDAKALQGSSTTAPTSATPQKAAAVALQDDRAPLATWAYRYNQGFTPSLTRAGSFGNLYRYNDQVVAPAGSKRRSIGVQFEFPSDWLQLDRNIGGIQYVDQRNGDKLYVLRAPLPADTSLESLPKAALGDLIFDSQGSLVKSGQTVEEYKVSSAPVLSDCPTGTCAIRRRFKIKYATVTGNGLRVERRALVDAYQVENDVYMLMTSSYAVKFEQKDSRERETVESIVSSFLIDI